MCEVSAFASTLCIVTDFLKITRFMCVCACVCVTPEDVCDCICICLPR